VIGCGNGWDGEGERLMNAVMTGAVRAARSRCTATVVGLCGLVIGFGVSAGPAKAAQAGVSPTLSNVLACTRQALGGKALLDQVKTLHLTSESQPAQESRGLPSKVETVLVFPDRYKRVSATEGPRPGTLQAVVGFDGRRLLTSMRFGPSEADDFGRAKHEYARYVLMLLVRQVPGIITDLVLRGPQPGKEWAELGITASGPDGFSATLLVDRTCLPLALQYERPRTLSDVVREQRASVRLTLGALAQPTPTGTTVVRIDLAVYSAFADIQFPTTLTTSIGGRVVSVEHVRTVEVNRPLPPNAFPPRR
jgi:hypothetical protein